MIYLHFATDYVVASPLPTECESCPGDAALRNVGALPTLQIQRLFRPFDLASLDDNNPEKITTFGPAATSFGPAMACNYDISIRIDRKTTGTSADDVVWVYDPSQQFHYVELQHVLTGKFTNSARPIYRELKTFDNDDTPADWGTATKAKLIQHNGTSIEFQVIDVDSGDNYKEGRLLKLVDRAGNSINVTYQSGTSGMALWRRTTIVDAYDHSSSWHYTVAGGNNVVNRIDGLPNGSVLTYTYGNGIPYQNAPYQYWTMLVDVSLQDGTHSTFEYGEHPGSEQTFWTATIFDPAADPLHRRKKVFFVSNVEILDPTLIGRVQIVRRGFKSGVTDGEVSLAIWQYPHATDPNLFYVFHYSGGDDGSSNALTRLTVAPSDFT